MTGYCVTEDHENCPDTEEDSYTCSCPCHENVPPQKV